MRRVLAGAAIGLALSSPLARADDFAPVQTRDAFVGVISGKALRRFGISLDVTPDGSIAGSAYGAKVTGRWTWEGEFFCRTLNFGSTKYERNCQQVLVKDRTVRFIADEGKGDQADLYLR